MVAAGQAAKAATDALAESQEPYPHKVIRCNHCQGHPVIYSVMILRLDGMIKYTDIRAELPEYVDEMPGEHDAVRCPRCKKGLMAPDSYDKYAVKPVVTKYSAKASNDNLDALVKSVTWSGSSYTVKGIPGS